jgi:hypothetical protein
MENERDGMGGGGGPRLCGDIGKLASGCRVFFSAGFFGGRNRIGCGMDRGGMIPNDAGELFIYVCLARQEDIG